MSQHDQRTQNGPGWALIVSSASAAVAALATAYWIMGSGTTFDGRHLAGAALGIIVFVAFGTRAFLLADERNRKRAARAARAAQDKPARRPVFRPWVPAPAGLPRFLNEDERLAWYASTHEIERVRV